MAKAYTRLTSYVWLKAMNCKYVHFQITFELCVDESLYFFKNKRNRTERPRKACKCTNEMTQKKRNEDENPVNN